MSPYRLDLFGVGADVFDRLVDLGALDIELLSTDRIAALMPDGVPPEQVARVVRASRLAVSAAVARDAGSVWTLRPRPLRIGRVQIVPVGAESPGAAGSALADPGTATLRLHDAAAFGTGLHPTTAMCLEAIDGIIGATPPASVLDVGTGSGVLALAALLLGVPHATGLDVDEEVLRIAVENAGLNGLAARFNVRRGGPEAVTGTWPLVVANVLTAPLVDMAPLLVRRIGAQGHLVLSGMTVALEAEVDRAYGRLGLQRLAALSRSGWVALVLRAPW